MLRAYGGENTLFYAVLVCASHKDPIVASNFDRLYLKNYFEFFKSVKSIL